MLHVYPEEFLLHLKKMYHSKHNSFVSSETKTLEEEFVRCFRSILNKLNEHNFEILLTELQQIYSSEYKTILIEETYKKALKSVKHFTIYFNILKKLELHGEFCNYIKTQTLDLEVSGKDENKIYILVECFKLKNIKIKWLYSDFFPLFIKENTHNIMYLYYFLNGVKNNISKSLRLKQVINKLSVKSQKENIRTRLLIENLIDFYSANISTKDIFKK
tara:strand:+ start:89 stop:742 length:654 start_codon:yes stop_codon:yes gene_type:complete